MMSYSEYWTAVLGVSGAEQICAEYDVTPASAEEFMRAAEDGAIEQGLDPAAVPSGFFARATAELAAAASPDAADPVCQGCGCAISAWAASRKVPVCDACADDATEGEPADRAWVVRHYGEPAARAWEEGDVFAGWDIVAIESERADSMGDAPDDDGTASDEDGGCHVCGRRCCPGPTCLCGDR